MKANGPINAGDPLYYYPDGSVGVSPEEKTRREEALRLRQLCLTAHPFDDSPGLEVLALAHVSRLAAHNLKPPFYMAYNAHPHPANGHWQSPYGEVLFRYAPELAAGMIWVMDKERFERYFRTNADTWEFSNG